MLICLNKKILLLGSASLSDNLMGFYLSFYSVQNKLLKSPEDRSRGGFHSQLSILYINTYMGSIPQDRGT